MGLYRDEKAEAAYARLVADEKTAKRAAALAVERAQEKELNRKRKQEIQVQKNIALGRTYDRFNAKLDYLVSSAFALFGSQEKREQLKANYEHELIAADQLYDERRATHL